MEVMRPAQRATSDPTCTLTHIGGVATAGCDEPRPTGGSAVVGVDGPWRPTTSSPSVSPSTARIETPVAPTMARRRARYRGSAEVTEPNDSSEAAGSPGRASARRRRSSRSVGIDAPSVPRRVGLAGERPGQRRASPGELGLHRPDRATERVGHVALGEILVVTEDDRLALAKREAPGRLLQRPGGGRKGPWG